MEFEKDRYGNIIDPFNVAIPDGIKRKWMRDLLIGNWDVETNGLDFHKPDEFRIIQLAIGLYREPPRDADGHDPIEFHNWFIDPQMAVGAGAMKVHGLYQSEYDDPEVIEKHGSQDLKGEPTFEELEEDVLHAMEDCELLSAYNGGFDMNALNSELKRLHGADYQWVRPWFDPLPWHRYLTKSRSGNRLGQVARHFNVGAARMKNEGGQLHDARVDIQMLNDVMWKMVPRLPQKTDEVLVRQMALDKVIAEEYYQKYN